MMQNFVLMCVTFESKMLTFCAALPVGPASISVERNPDERFSAIVSWQAGPEANPPITGYVLEFRKGSGMNNWFERFLCFV